MASAQLECPNCRTTSSPGSIRCSNCDSLLGPDGTFDPDATQIISEPKELDPNATQLIDTSAGRTPPGSVASGGVPTGWTRAASRAPKDYSELTAGAIIGERYEILEILGEGGMGAVYRARDNELDRIVALKVIRPELANNPDILRMFKQELILARQVTHSNVIRIYDLGLADGLRFITMPFVEGHNLKTLLEERGKLPADEAAAIIVQVCEGLAAAHQEEVVHRDLKPQNIMIDGHNRALVLDFGLATESGGSDGRLLGTPLYMSPEQAMKKEVDARSDLFAVGIIFFELLTGTLPFEGQKLEETLKKRVTESAPSPSDREPTIPKAVNEIVLKCLERDLTKRYQSASEIVRDIQIWQGVLVPGHTRRWRWLSFGFAALLVLGIGTETVQYFRSPVAPPKPVTVLLADFANQTGEPLLNGALEPLFGVAMEGASFVNNYPHSQALSVARQIRAGTQNLDEKLARLVAQREGLNVVVSGTISKSGNTYIVKAGAVDAVSGNRIAQSEVKAATKEKLPGSMAGLAQPIRRALGDRAPASKQAQAGETFTARSLEAAHEYALAQEAQLAGKYDDALQHYRRAVTLDPNMARAYSGMAVVYRNRGEEAQAEQNIKIALSKPGMSERERFRIRGAKYVISGSYEHAADEYKMLLDQYPFDNAGHANLAIAFLYLRNLPRTIEEGRRAIEIYPHNITQRNNIASYLLYAGKFDEAVQEASEVIRNNPKFERAYVVKALAMLASGHTDQAVEMYGQLSKISPRGASLASTGLADFALFEGRTQDAVKMLQEGIQADLSEGQKSRAAIKQVLLGQTYVQLGQRAPAIAAAEEAVRATTDADVLHLAARVLVEAGKAAGAQEIGQMLSRKLDSEPQSFGRLIAGEIALKKGDIQEAIRQMRESRKLVDTWIGHFDLGRAYLAADAFTDADGEFDTCIRRRGEAASLPLDLLPTYSYLPAAYYYAGRAQAEIASAGAADLFKTFLSLRSRAATTDPMVSDAKKRTAGLSK